MAKSNENSGSKVNLLVILLIAASFFSGYLYNKVQSLQEKVKGVQAPVENAGNPPPPTPYAAVLEPPDAGDHILGNKNAPIMLIEYSDLECPFCKRVHPTLKDVVKAYGGKVAWVYRHFPIPELHSKAPKESEAVECAKDQGGEDAFWKLTDKIYEVTPANNGLDHSTFPALVQSVGLNADKFKTCFDSGKMLPRVQKDIQSGIKAGIQGTPGIILVNVKTGKKTLIPGAVPLEDFKRAIDQLL